MEIMWSLSSEAFWGVYMRPWSERGLPCVCVYLDGGFKPSCGSQGSCDWPHKARLWISILLYSLSPGLVPLCPWRLSFRVTFLEPSVPPQQALPSPQKPHPLSACTLSSFLIITVCNVIYFPKLLTYMHLYI